VHIQNKIRGASFLPANFLFLSVFTANTFCVYINQETEIILCVNRLRATDVVFLPIILILLRVYLCI